MTRKILIIDDDAVTRRLLQGLLAGKGVELAIAENRRQAREAFAAADFNRVIMDQRLPDGESGLDIVREMRRQRPGRSRCGSPVVQMCVRRCAKGSSTT